jgi:hypothetical protein
MPQTPTPLDPDQLDPPQQAHSDRSSHPYAGPNPGSPWEPHPNSLVPPPTRSHIPSDPAPPSLPAEAAEPESFYQRNAPLSFIPHNADGTASNASVVLRSGRYGDLSEHDLVRLLDSIEDERARSRFRESLYIAVFAWLALAALIIWGPHYLWHAPVLRSPIDVMKEHELTVLNAPVLPHPRPVAPPPDDRRPHEPHRASEPRPRATAPEPTTPQPTPAPTPTPVQPAPTVAPPTHAIAPAPIVDAPTPQPSARRAPFNAASPSDNLPGLASGSHENGPIVARGRGRGGAPLGTGVEILSPNPDNVDFDPYLRRLLHQIYDQWLPLIPEEVQPPLSKTGSTLIRFRILPDGKIGGMWLDGSTHDDAINRAAWGSIVGVGQFEPLPHNYHQPSLELRIDFEIKHPGEE